MEMENISLHIDKITVEEFGAVLPRVRKSLEDKHGIVVPGHCNEFIKRCIRLKNRDEEKTVKLIKQIHTMANDLHEWDAVITPSSYEQLYFNNYCNPIPKRDSNGRRIFIIRPAIWNPKEMCIDQALSALWIMAIYTTSEFIETQLNGIVTVWDFTDFSFEHAWAVKHRRILRFAIWAQNSVIGKIVGVHFIFHPRIISVIYAAIKPLIKEKLRKRIHFHGDDLSSLHKYVEPSVLPSYLGGDIDDSKHCDTDFLKNLVQQDAFFNDWMSTGFPIK